VSSISIDKEKDLVTVSGNVDPANLIEAIKKIGKKKAHILYYVKEEPPLKKEDGDSAGKVNPTKLVDPVKKNGKTKILPSEKFPPLVQEKCNNIGSAHEDDFGKVNPTKLVDPVKKIGKTKILWGEKLCSSHEDDSGKENPTKLEEPVKKIGKTKADLKMSLVQEKTLHGNDFVKENPTNAESNEKDQVKEHNHPFKKTHGTAHCHDSDSSLDDNDDHVVHDESCEFVHHHDLQHHNIHKMKPRQHGHVHEPHRHHHPQPYNVHGNGEEINESRLFGNPPAAATGGYGYVPAGPPPARLRHGYRGYDHHPPLLPSYYDYGYDSYYKQPDPPVGNSVYHSLSDDNTRTCTVM